MRLVSGPGVMPTSSKPPSRIRAGHSLLVRFLPAEHHGMIRSSSFPSSSAARRPRRTCSTTSRRPSSAIERRQFAGRRCRALVVPVVEDLGEDIGHPRARQSVREEIAGCRLAAVGEVDFFDQRSRLGRHMGKVDHDASKMRVRVQHRGQQSALPPPNSRQGSTHCSSRGPARRRRTRPAAPPAMARVRRLACRGRPPDAGTIGRPRTASATGSTGLPPLAAFSPATRLQKLPAHPQGRTVAGWSSLSPSERGSRQTRARLGLRKSPRSRADASRDGAPMGRRRRGRTSSLDPNRFLPDEVPAPSRATT